MTEQLRALRYQYVEALEDSRVVLELAQVTYNKAVAKLAAYDLLSGDLLAISEGNRNDLV